MLSLTPHHTRALTTTICSTREAAYLLNTYIEGPPNVVFDPPFLAPHDGARSLTIIELGSGTGVVSAQCAERLAGRACTIITTDLPDVCPLLEKNLCKYAKSSGPKLLVRPLAWGNYDHAQAIWNELKALHADNNVDLALGPSILTHIICSDLVYFPELLAPLLRTLLHLTSPPFAASSDTSDHPTVVISYKIRSLSKEVPFWSAFGLWFTFEPVLSRQSPQQQPNAAATGNGGARAGEPADVSGEEPEEESWRRFGSAGDDEIFIFVARRRPESLTWDVPADDGELLDGVGAGGTPSRKSDPTFETLLLMNMED